MLEMDKENWQWNFVIETLWCGDYDKCISHLLQSIKTQIAMNRQALADKILSDLIKIEETKYKLIELSEVKK